MRKFLFTWSSESETGQAKVNIIINAIQQVFFTRLGLKCVSSDNWWTSSLDLRGAIQAHSVLMIDWTARAFPFGTFARMMRWTSPQLAYKDGASPAARRELSHLFTPWAGLERIPRLPTRRSGMWFIRKLPGNKLPREDVSRTEKHRQDALGTEEKKRESFFFNSFFLLSWPAAAVLLSPLLDSMNAFQTRKTCSHHRLRGHQLAALDFPFDYIMTIHSTQLTVSQA